MCGICGAVHAHGAVDPRASIDRQLHPQHHRGPDARGSFAGKRGVIGQNRLAVIDLAQGNPPLTTEDEALGAVLNGEIYNFEEIQDALRARGHRLSSNCDTEVIAHLAEDHEAVALARRLDGMFAFATWNRREEQLTLGRDRLGKKPLYYYASPDVFVFASEIKGVLAHPQVPSRLNERAIDAYLTFGYVPTPETFFAGVRSLPPAHVLTLSPGEEPLIQRYWQLGVPGIDGVSAIELSDTEAASEVRRLLQAAIGRRLIADVPLGAFLSGGIDSSAIVALMAGTMGQKVTTFSMGFEDRDGFDERPYARAVAERFGTVHHEHVAHASAVDLVEKLVWHHDQPFGDSSAIPTYLVCQAAREHVTVALSGDGGDELFGGYERFAAALAVGRFRSLPGLGRRAARGAADLLPARALQGRAGSLQRFARVAELGLPWAYLEWISFVPEAWRRQLLHAPDDWAREDYGARWIRTAGAAPLDRLLALNLDTYLLDDLLVKADRMSMASSLEVRSPFLDTDLLEFTARIAPGLKVRGLSLKRVLKAAVSDLLPPEILSRRKRGFGVPLDRWFREDLADYSTGLLGPAARVREHLDGPALDRMLSEHATGARVHGHALWSILTLEVFLRGHDW